MLGVPVNFYKHNLGDYDGHTAHLSWDEDQAYTRLLRVYYRREAPVPDAERYRLTRAASKAQRAAVDAVLSEFFTRDGDVWRQRRCDEEIAAYQAQASTNRRIARQRFVDGSLDDSLTSRSPVYSAEREPKQNQETEPDTREVQVHVGSAPKNGARHAIPDYSPIVLALPLRDGTEFPVCESFVKELEPLYPAVDVPQTLREMKGWLVGNPDRRKTRKGARRFITTWLQREQDKHGG